MVCNGCGNPEAWRTYANSEGEICDLCGGLGNLDLPDVYFRKPYHDPNLGTGGQVGGVFVESKRHKATLMREQGLFELGDKVRGSRIEDKHYQQKAREQGLRSL